MNVAEDATSTDEATTIAPVVQDITSVIKTDSVEEDVSKASDQSPIGM